MDIEIKLNAYTNIASSAGISPDQSGGGKKFGEMPAINRHKNLHCAYRLAHANFDKRKLRGSSSLGPVYEFVCISFRTDNLNCFRSS
jgi:hypothetical protein